MKKSIGFSWSRFLAMFCLCSLLLAASFAFAQETTGGIQGVVKDESGAVVSGATVEVSGPALIGTKSATTDNGGYYRFANLPPGTYTVSVKSGNFAAIKQTNILVTTGSLKDINVSMKATGGEVVVDVTTEAASQIDTTTSKVQSNVTSEIIKGIPKGRSYQSVITFAPGARLEPLQDQRFGQGYQIDGASSSENTYLVEGQDTGGVVRGEGAVSVPFEFVQEVQIKSSGFEAEYGGALGGVVNVIQKRGSNAWHGSIFSHYQGDVFNAAPSRSLRLNPSTTLSGRVPEAFEYYQPKKDHFRRIDPGFEVGGPVFKDRLWAFASFAPAFQSLRRTVNFSCTGGTNTGCLVAPIVGPKSFTRNINTYNGFARVDGLLWNRVRLFGSYQTQYERANGTSLPTADSPYGQRNNAIIPSVTTPTANTVHPDQFNYGIGYTAPNVVYNTGADITLTPALVSTTRFGYFFTDIQSRGLPEGIRFVQQTTSGTSATCTQTGTPPQFPTGCDRNGVPMPASLVVSAGAANLGNNLQTQFDKTSRRSFSQDLAYFKRTGFGTHNFKVGYAYNKVAENMLIGFKSALVNVTVGNTKYSPVTGTGTSNCAAITTASGSQYGTAAACQGRYGFYTIRQGVETKGNVGSDNQAIYVQDSWTVGGGLTLNLGVRFDKEFLPSFKPGAEEISFEFTDKVAPRLGASWDVFRNGKMKVYGSYGKFFDIMKYELPQGSFGGQYWHDCVYTLDDPNFGATVPVRDASGNYCPTGGGATQASGTVAPSSRFIENNDLRIPANDPSDSRIVPGIKPMEQHESVFGVDWAITPGLALETRWARKRLDRTIEDIGALTDAGEAFFIGNPGFGEIADQSGICAACARQPKAVREYDGLEFRLTKRASAKWFGTVSYTWSRLYGNYSGLSSTDENGRVDPNVSRMFDEPQYQFDSHGKYAMGRLATDRPHTFKGFGYYRMKWLGMETLIGATQQWFSGTPITTFITSAGSTPQPVENRGNFANVTIDSTGNWSLGGVSAKRTPMFTQTDLNFVHEVKLSKTNENLRIVFENNITNLFNEKNVLNYQTALLRSGTLCPAHPVAVGSCGTVAGEIPTSVWTALMSTGWDYVSVANAAGRVRSGTYGQPNLFQGSRTLRFKVAFNF
ncbi:MAG TPA: TonB-dependent receptor [Terriglobales bacterium]|nr:TonB-dependent receptor [Terriglobales bacterium]